MSNFIEDAAVMLPLSLDPRCNILPNALPELVRLPVLR